MIRKIVPAIMAVTLILHIPAVSAQENSDGASGFSAGFFAARSFVDGLLNEYSPEDSESPFAGIENTAKEVLTVRNGPVKNTPDTVTSKNNQMLTENGVDGKKIVILDVPYINQRIHFPNGCESVSAVMALQYIGVKITPEKFVADYLDMGQAPYIKNGIFYACDPKEYFPGDPRTSGGWGCYPGVIKKAADKMGLENIRAVVLKDVSLSTLCSEYIDNDIPVVFWGTIDMKAPGTGITWTIEGTEQTHTWTTPFHCLLLVGYDGTGYYFNDPWQSKSIRYDRDAVETAYSGIGRHALVFVKNSK